MTKDPPGDASGTPRANVSYSWGKPPSLLASPLLPKGEASAKGEDRTGSPMTNDATCFTWGDPKTAVAHKGQRTDKKNG
ncbi:MAG: hypothetical protein V7K67_25125 [Nostoc sp.]